MITITWTTGKGQEIEVTVASEYDLDRQGVRKTSGRKVVEMTLAVDGEDVFAPGGLVRINHPMAVARIGNVGVTQDNYDRIEEAVAAVKSEIAEHNAACDRHAESIDAIDGGRRSIERAARCGE